MVHNQTGSAFGNYHLLRPVGWGGMSVVYHGLQPDSSGDSLAPGNVTEVAVKIMNAQKEDGLNFYRRFQREVRVASTLAHPHILPVCDYGMVEDQLYLVTPYMTHGTLEHRLKERRLLTLDEAIILATQIGQALDYAHARNIIHRDVKPHNIMVGGENRYYLTDFGLVKILDGSTRLTMSGRIIGTPAYMSPEQASGTELDQRTDLYSLGIVLYECLVGRLPYLFETQSQAIGQHLNARAIPPRRINARFPAAVERVLLHALEKDPTKRFQSASEMVAALEKASKQCPAWMRDCPLVTPQQIELSRVAAASTSKSWVAPRKAPVSMWGFAGALILSLAIVFSMQSGSLDLEPLVSALNLVATNESDIVPTKSSPRAEATQEEMATPQFHTVTEESFNSPQMISRYVSPSVTRPVPDDFVLLEMQASPPEVFASATPTGQQGNGSAPVEATSESAEDGSTDTPTYGNGVGNGNGSSGDHGNNGGGTGSDSNNGNGTGNSAPGNGNGGGTDSTVGQENGNGGDSGQPADTGIGNGSGNANGKPDKDQ